MALILNREKRVILRIAYMGIPASGKSSILKSLHASSPSESRGDFVHDFLGQDRGLYFDFEDKAISVIPGFTTFVRLLTLPGYPTRTQTYRRLLKGIDGIAYVVDTQWERMEENVKSFAAMQDILVEQKTSLLEIPYVLLYNKRDIPNGAPFSYLDFTFNQRSESASAFEIHGVEGQGLKESLQVILDQWAKKYSMAG
ncbi:MAG: GTPase domain-containing protein [Verrucomicrobiota bacterium]